MYSTEISPYMFTSIYLINLSNFHSFRIKVLEKNVFPRSNVNKLPKYFGLGQNTPYVHPSFVQVYRSNWSNSLYMEVEYGPYYIPDRQDYSYNLKLSNYRVPSLFRYIQYEETCGTNKAPTKKVKKTCPPFICLSNENVHSVVESVIFMFVN